MLADLIVAAGDGFWFELHDAPALTSLAGLGTASKGHFDFAELPLVTDLQPLTGVKTLGALVTNSAKLTSLAGVDKLGAVSERLAIINNPKLPKAAFDALIAKVVEPAMHCFGDWGVCDCIGIRSP